MGGNDCKNDEEGEKLQSRSDVLSCQWIGQTPLSPTTSGQDVDTTLHSFLIVVTAVFRLGWQTTMESFIQVYVAGVAYAWFVNLIFVGSYTILNLTVALTAAKYEEVMHEEDQLADEDEDISMHLAHNQQPARLSGWRRRREMYLKEGDFAFLAAEGNFAPFRTLTHFPKLETDNKQRFSYFDVCCLAPILIYIVALACRSSIDSIS